MLRIVFTIDYELYGNGDGNSRKLIVNPTKRLLKLFDKFGAKLTIMAEVAQIYKFKEYRDTIGKDDYHYEAITEQLRRAVQTGHDVQLHVHPSYLNASHQNGRWEQDWIEYNLSTLPYERIHAIVQKGKQLLCELLTPVKPDYQCRYFRAANWSMCPSENIVKALLAHGFLIDTSVFKNGKRSGMIEFDYSTAWSDCLPWPVDETEVNNRDLEGRLMEFPIYCEQRSLFDFISLNRFWQTWLGKRHSVLNVQKGYFNQEIRLSQCTSKFEKLCNLLNRKYPLKMDFNQCTGKQLIRGLESAWQKYGHLRVDVPFVLIGHSKSYNGINAIEVKRFLKYVTKHQDRFAFSTFHDFDLSAYRNDTFYSR